MKLIFLGAPGAGKGTQARLLADEMGIPQISTGDIFREAIRQGTPLGMEAKTYMDKGELVPDSIVVGIVAERLKQEDCTKGFILDGFPRTVAQAEALEGICPVDLVLDIAVGEDELIRRLTGRLVCRGCGASSHREWTQSDRCKECGGELIQRADDTLETVERRIAVYNAQTAPLIAYYQGKGKLQTVDGSRAVEEIQREIRRLVNGTRA